MADPKATDLIQLAHTLASHPARLAGWREGSCAAKLSEDRLLVTARGADLATLAPSDLVEMDLKKMTALLAAETAGPAEIAEAQVTPDSAPASSDALLHAHLLGFAGVRICVHLHPVEINQIACSPRVRQFADRRSTPAEIVALGSAMPLVPYADPGLPLAKEVKRRMVLWNDRYKTVPKVMLILNHGMFVLGADAAEIVKIAEAAVKAAQVFIGASLLGGPVFMTPNNVAQIEALGEL